MIAPVLPVEYACKGGESLVVFLFDWKYTAPVRVVDRLESPFGFK